MIYKYQCSLIIEINASSKDEAEIKLKDEAKKQINGKFDSKIINEINWFKYPSIIQKIIEQMYGKNDKNTNLEKILDEIQDSEEYNQYIINKSDFSLERIKRIIEACKLKMFQRIVHFLDISHKFFDEKGDYKLKPFSDSEFKVAFNKAVNDKDTSYEFGNETTYRNIIDWTPFRTELKKRVKSGEFPYYPDSHYLI